MRNYTYYMNKELRLRVSRAIRRRIQGFTTTIVSKAISSLNFELVIDRSLNLYYKKSSRFITWDVSAIGPKLNKKAISFSTLNEEKKLTAVQTNSFPNPFGQELSIVIQGQVISENFLTKNIVEFYLKNFKEINVIVSTWDDTPSLNLAAFDEHRENSRFHLILSKPPEVSGIFNVNNQIVSTRHGMEHALGISEFAIKTRTDQILSSPLLLRNLQTLWKLYGESQNSRNRIVVSSFNTFAFRFYGASDMFQFGKTEDLLNYWDQELDERPISELSEPSHSMRLEGMKLVAEVYLNTNYFKKIMKVNPCFAWKESLDFIRDAFIVADQHALGQTWLKNTHLSNRWNFNLFPHKYYELSHLDWIGLLSDSEVWLSQEHLIDSKEFYAFE